MLAKSVRAIAHKSAGETCASPDLHNPFSNSGAFLLTAEIFRYHGSVCEVMRALRVSKKNVKEPRVDNERCDTWCTW